MKFPATGFELPIGKIEVFIVTDAKRKTENLARNILRKMMLPENPDTVKEVLYWLRKAEIDLRCIPNGKFYYVIKGDKFTQLCEPWEIEDKTVQIIEL